jgi:hypothetical protein
VSLVMAVAPVIVAAVPAPVSPAGVARVSLGSIVFGVSADCLPPKHVEDIKDQGVRQVAALRRYRH